MRRLIFFLLVLNLMVPFCFAEGRLKVEKKLKDSTLKVGDQAIVQLRFINPFNRELHIRIVDKNIIANNGLDIQCLEYTLPAERESLLEYSPIELFKDGEFVLDRARVDYVNPETSKEETVESNTLKVEVKKSKKAVARSQGITTIYQCGGTSIRSTSYSSSGSSMSISIGSQGGVISTNIGQEINRMEEMFNEMFNRQPRNIQSRIGNNQQAQDTSVLKRQIAEQARKNEKMRKEFIENLMRNQKFQENNQELHELGYNMTSITVEPMANNSGSFSISYEKPNGERASLKGELENGKLVNLHRWTAEDMRRMLGILQSDRRFRKYNNSLQKNGFIRLNPRLENKVNESIIVVPYKKGDENATIVATFDGNKIKEIRLETKKGYPYLWFLVFIAIAILVCYVYYRYYKHKKVDKEGLKEKEVKKEKRLDYKSEARKMLVRAKDLFARGYEKEAYTMVSRAVRFYYRHHLGLGKELTRDLVLKELKKRGMPFKQVEGCLDLCDLVKFAKYKPNKGDFGRIVALAEKILL